MFLIALKPLKYRWLFHTDAIQYYNHDIVMRYRTKASAMISRFVMYLRVAYPQTSWAPKSTACAGFASGSQADETPAKRKFYQPHNGVPVLRCCAIRVNSALHYRRSQDFVWGALFRQKSWLRPFLVVTYKRRSKYASKSNPPSKKCPKIWLLLWLGGALRVLGMHLHIFL